MTNDEKAKAYEMALEAARKELCVEPIGDTKQVLRNIFPELRESEDERIVNWLYDMLKHGIEDAPKGCPDNPIAEKALSWLEKQKEPKLAHDDLQKSFEAGQTSIVDNPEQYGLCKKPAWSEEDEKIKSCISLALTDVDEQRFKDFGTTLKDCLAWVKSLRPGWKPTEEQMEALQRAIDACESEWAYQDDELRSLLNDLKKL